MIYRAYNEDREVVEEGKSIGELLAKLNSGEWYFAFRRDTMQLDGYLYLDNGKADADVNGEKADRIYDLEFIKEI